MHDKIKESFTESIQTKIAALEILPDPIFKASNMIIDSLIAGNKIISCAGGGSVAHAEIFTAKLLNKYSRQRPPLPSIALNGNSMTINSIANDVSFDHVFSKQVKALGQAGDILLAICTTGNTQSVVNAMQAALTRDMTIVAVTGAEGGEMAALIGENDVEIRVPSNNHVRIEEVHLFVINSLCENIDAILFPTVHT